MSGLSKINYSDLSDEDLVKLIRSGDDGAFNCLYERYLKKIRTMTYSFQGLGYDVEDLIQEATIGFFTAINVYDFNSSSFSTFCYICMRRLLLSLLKKKSRKKALPNSAIICDDETFFGVGYNTSPEQEYIAKEDFIKLKNRIKTELSDNEREVLLLYLSGHNYSQIAEKLAVERKVVDNALQRIRKKLR